MRIAALDLGSNSFHLLVADVHIDGTFTAVAREKEMLRLGDDVARHGRIPEATAQRAIGAVRRLKNLADALGAREVIAKATSAIRSAANGSELVDRIEAETGVEIEVIGGVEEARLIFAAARASVESHCRMSPPDWVGERSRGPIGVRPSGDDRLKGSGCHRPGTGARTQTGEEKARRQPC